MAAVQAQNGLGNQSSVYNQLQGVANGTGPNPAAQQLANATGANVANQAALMAGQRGSSANAGMIARQAAQQGANTQQQAAGQGAALQAQQSLNAMGAMGNIANQQVGQQAAATSANTGAAQGLQSNVLNSIAQQNNANVGMQSNVNSANAGLIQTTMGGQNNMIGGVMSGIGQAFGLAEGGVVPPADTIPGNPAPMAAAPAPQQKGMDLKSLAKMAGMASGGPVMQPMDPMMMPAMPTAPIAPPPPTVTKAGPKSKVGQALAGINPADNSNKPVDGATLAGQTMGNALGQGLKSIFGGPSGAGQDVMMAAQGGKVPALVSPGEKYLDPKAVAQVKRGANPMAVGETIPGKPVVGGAVNDYANDVVPKTLEEGGLVLPRSVTQSKNPHWAAMKFVQEHMKANGGMVTGLHSKRKGKKK